MKRCLAANGPPKSLNAGLIKSSILFTVPVPLERPNYLHLHHPPGFHAINQKTTSGLQSTERVHPGGKNNVANRDL